MTKDEESLQELKDLIMGKWNHGVIHGIGMVKVSLKAVEDKAPNTTLTIGEVIGVVDGVLAMVEKEAGSKSK